ncbi:MAG: tetratricopeptide repeat protein [Myxococcales bacterium]|nr:tetratricopeptide repeat protein [Myxococcales bacterium]
MPQRDDQGPKPAPPQPASGDDFPGDAGDLFDAIIVDEPPRPVYVPTVPRTDAPPVVAAGSGLVLPPQPTTPDIDIDTDDLGAPPPASSPPAPAAAPVSPASAAPAPAGSPAKPRFTPAGSPGGSAPAPAFGAPGKPAAKPSLSAASLLNRGEEQGGSGLPGAMPSRNPPPAHKTIELDAEMLSVRNVVPPKPPPPPSGGEGRVAEPVARPATQPSPAADSGARPVAPPAAAEPPASSSPGSASASSSGLRPSADALGRAPTLPDTTMKPSPAAAPPASDSGSRLSFGEPSPAPRPQGFAPPGSAAQAAGTMRTQLVGRVPPGAPPRPVSPVSGDKSPQPGPGGPVPEASSGPRPRSTPALGVPQQGQPARAAASGPITRHMSNPLLTAENPFIRYAQTQIQAWEMELATQPDLFRAARLNYEIARLHEYPLGDLNQASTFYLRAHGLAPEYLPILRGARRVLLAQKNYTRALPLFDAEVRLTADPRRKAALYYAKGSVLADVLRNEPEARVAYAAARELDPGNVSILKALEQIDARTAAWDSLERDYAQIASAVEKDPRYRSALVVRRAHLFEVRQKNPGAAVELLETALDLDPTAPGAFAALKRMHHAQGRWRELIGVLEREAGLISDPDLKAMAYYRIARMHSERLGNRDKAILALERSVAENPRYRLVVEELIRLYGAADRHDAQVKMLELLAAQVEAAPERISILYQIGELQEQRLYNEDEAIRWYEGALAIEPTFRPSLRALSKLYTRRKLWEPLIHMLSNEADAAEDGARAAAAHARMAEVFEVHLEQPEQAIDHHARALALHPGLPTSFKALTRLYGDAGRYHELIELLERGIDEAAEEDRRIAYLFRIADLYCDYLREPVQAAHAFRRVLKIDPDHLGAIHALQRCCELAGRFKELVDALEIEASKTLDKPRIVALMYRAAEILDDKLEDREAALARYRRALELDPKYAPALAGLGRLYYRTGRWDDLLSVYERELAITPPGRAAVALLHTMGNLAEDKVGDDSKAIDCYRRAIAIDPKHGPSLHALERLLGERKAFAEMVDVLELELKGLGDAKARALVAYRIGRAYEEHLGDLAKAVVAYHKATEAVPDYRPALDGLSRVRVAQEAWHGVVEDLAQEAATSKEPALATSALLRAGEIFSEQLAQPERAIAAFERVLERDPSSLSALLALEPLYRQQGLWKSLVDLYLRQSKALADDGARVAALREVAHLYENQAMGDADQLRAAYTAILQRLPSDPVALAALERIALIARDDQLLTRVDAQLASGDDDAALLGAYYTRLGETLERAGTMASALKAYEMGLAHDADSLGAMYGLVRVATALDDPRALVAAKSRLALAERGGETAANLLVETAKTRLQRLDDAEGATRDLEGALERYPDHVEAADMLYKILLMLDHGTRLVEKLSQAAESARSTERSGALWLRIAELYADELGNLAGGISVLRRVLRDRPQHVPMLMLLADLYNRNQQWGDAAETYGEVVRISSSQDALFAANGQLAAILADHLGDLARARSYLEAALQLRPDDRATLLKLTDIQARLGDGAAAAETARRLLRASTTADERVASIIHLATIEQNMGRRQQALEALLNAVVLEGPDGKAAHKYKSMLADGDDWEPYENAMLKHLQTAAGDDARLCRAYLEIAEVQGGPLGQTQRALRTLEMGISEVKNDVPLRVEYGARLRADGRVAEAIAAYRQLVGLYPAHAEGWRGLVSCYVDRNRMPEAGLALAPLCVLGAASESDMRALTKMTPKPASAAPNSFNPDMLKAACDRNHQAAVAEKLLFAINPSLSKLYLGDLQRFGVNPKEKITARSGNPLRTFVDKIAAIYGIPDYDLYVFRGAGTVCSLEFGALPVLLVPATVLRLPEPQQAFVIARALATVQRGLQALSRFKASELMLILAAAARTSAPNYGSNLADGAALDDLQRRIVKAMARKDRQLLNDASAEYAQSAPVDFNAWYADNRISATRAAALIAADLPSCVAVLRQEDQALLYLEGEDLVLNSDVISDLVRYWGSDPAIELRRRAGLLQG